MNESVGDKRTAINNSKSHKMKLFWTAIIKMPKSIIVVTAIAFLMCLIYQIVTPLYNFHFPIWLSNVGFLVYNLLLAVLGGSILYYFTYQLPLIHKRERLDSYIDIYINEIHGINDHLRYALAIKSKEQGRKFEEFTKENVDSKLKQIPTNIDKDIEIRGEVFTTWKEAFVYCSQSMEELMIINSDLIPYIEEEAYRCIKNLQIEYRELLKQLDYIVEVHDTFGSPIFIIHFSNWLIYHEKLKKKYKVKVIDPNIIRP